MRAVGGIRRASLAAFLAIAAAVVFIEDFGGGAGTIWRRLALGR